MRARAIVGARAMGKGPVQEEQEMQPLSEVSTESKGVEVEMPRLLPSSHPLVFLVMPPIGQVSLEPGKYILCVTEQSRMWGMDRRTNRQWTK